MAPSNLLRIAHQCYKLRMTHGEETPAPFKGPLLTSHIEGLSAVARVYFGVVGAIGLVTGAALLLAPGSTADYFAWPIAPPQTATFMGAGYLGTGITLLILLFLGRSWTDVRLIVPPI